jgi:Zn-dependent membrane protease YugP
MAIDVVEDPAHYFIVMAAAGSIVILLMIAHPQVRAIPGSILFWLCCSMLMVFCFLGLILDAPRMFIWMSLALLSVRIAFDFVVLPIRSVTRQENVCREDCRRMIDNQPDKKFYNYRQTATMNVSQVLSLCLFPSNHKDD